MRKIKLAIITSHPIQYNAPFFAELARSTQLDVLVFYTWGEDSMKKFDPGFGKTIAWDIPLLEGYEYRFVKNSSQNPGSHHFRGIDNPTLIAEVEAWGANAILVYGWAFKSHLNAIRYFHNKIPILFRGDSTLLSRQNLLKRFFRKILLTWVYRHINCALYVGTNNEKYFKEFGLKQKQLLWVPHAVDNNRFAGSMSDWELKAQTWRSNLKIPSTDTVFVFAAKLDANKNASLLVNAFNLLQKPKTHLIIIGSGKEERSIKELALNNASIHFLPFQNQHIMPVVYRLGDVFIMPSLAETWGLALNEAMASGRAVIASDACGASVDLISNAQNGYVFKSGDVLDLKNKMELTSNKEQSALMGRKSLEIIANWNYLIGVKLIEELLTKSTKF